MVRQALIIAGGRGTRMAPYTDSNPKPMYPVNGVPFIVHLIKQIKGFGINRIVILLGYLPEKITGFLGDGSEYGVNLEYDITSEDYETGDRMSHARNLLDDSFLFMYCDNYCPINIEKLEGDFKRNDALIQISAYRNTDNYTKNNLLLDRDTGQVVCYDKERLRADTRGVDIGYAIVSRKVIDMIDCKGVNFAAHVYPKLVKQGRLYATLTEHRYYSIGSWVRMPLTETFFSNKPTVFLDRDGTINVRPPKACYVERPEDFVWLEGAIEAIRLLKAGGYRIILVTNQPGIARGILTKETLVAIHEKMQNDLIKNGIDNGIDDIFYCPHNWDEDCECRKPKPGMLYEAQKKYSLDLTKCYMIGDDERDIEAGQSADCICIQVSDEYTLLDAVRQIISKESAGNESLC